MQAGGGTHSPTPAALCHCPLCVCLSVSAAQSIPALLLTWEQGDPSEERPQPGTPSHHDCREPAEWPRLHLGFSGPGHGGHKGRLKGNPQENVESRTASNPSSFRSLSVRVRHTHAPLTNLHLPGVPGALRRGRPAGGHGPAQSSPSRVFSSSPAALDVSKRDHRCTLCPWHRAWAQGAAGESAPVFVLPRPPLFLWSLLGLSANVLLRPQPNALARTSSGTRPSSSVPDETERPWRGPNCLPPVFGGLSPKTQVWRSRENPLLQIGKRKERKQKEGAKPPTLSSLFPNDQSKSFYYNVKS